ncbi:MAG: DUF5684 domain-containing protein [Myxococcaceae bacterium]
MNGSGGGGIGAIIFLIIELAIMVAVIAGIWKVFVKAGQPGWAAIVPFYNIYVITQIAGRPAWWIVLFFIPLVSIVAAIILMIDVAKAFGKGTGFGIGLALLGIVFFPILGFGDATYQGAPKAA